MKKVEYLTNERLKYKFKSFFNLSNFGISIAKQKIAREETTTLDWVISELDKLPDEIKPNQE
ncbi:MAG: hypothetical protein KR126chlam6_00794 [Candidatus Anoxychlamydiales bacterium]|nr:hypothetical protein [Candidatus Anoxychlamydiales bacterium]